MKRIDSANKSVDLFGAGKHGFRDGNKALGINPTELTADFFNHLQEEVSNVIEGAGIALDTNDRSQLKTAIEKMIKGGDYKASVRAASTAAINLAAPGANIDDVAMIAGDRFLEKNNATLENRGIYIWNGAAVPATRAPDADAGDEFNGGAIIPVEEGTVNADTNWQLTNNGVVIIGVTGLTFNQIGTETSPVLPGSLVEFFTASAPSGYLKANGAGVLAASYPALTTAIYCGDANNPTALFGYRANNADGSGRNIAGNYLILPDARGEFIRGWDDGRGIDSGRVFGSFQASQVQGAVGAAAGGCAGGANPVVTGTITIGTETRPRNIAVLVCIKY